MKYAKLTENGIEYAPQNKGNVLNFGLKSNETALLALGYLPVVDGEIPEAGENQTLNPVFTQEKGRIVRGYEAVEIAPDALTQRVEAIEAAIISAGSADMRAALNSNLKDLSGSLDGMLVKSI